MRRSCLTRLPYLLPTPFDHQPIAIPAIPSVKAVVENILPSQPELSRVDEVQLLLQRLPAACDAAKELQHSSQYASRYYRARLHRGSQLQEKQLKFVAEATPRAAQEWARKRLQPVTDPFQCA